MVTYSMLVNEISPYIVSQNETSYTDGIFSGITMIEENDTAENDMVCIGEGDCIARLLVRGSYPKGCLMIAAGNDPHLDHAPMQNASVVVTSLTLGKLYNLLNGVFLQNQKWQSRIRECAAGDTRTLVSRFSGAAGISVMLLTPELDPVIRCIREEDAELFSTDPKLAAQNPGQSVQALMGQLEEGSTEDIAFSERSRGLVYALIPIVRKNQLRGYLYACSSGKRDSLRSMLYALAPACFDSLEKEGEGAGGDSFQEVIAELIGPDPGDFEKLEIRMRHLAAPPKPFKRSIVVRFVDDDGKVAPVTAQALLKLYQDLKKLVPNDHIALMNDMVYLMTSEDALETPISEKMLAQMEEVLKRHQAYAMISNPSFNLKGVRVLQTQCYQILPVAVAVRIGNETERRCLTYDRYAPYYIIHLCQKSVKREMGIDDIIYLCHPAINTLTRYDRAYNSNLRDTLFNYLMNDRSIARTSEAMFIHRNTTIYKINKIHELVTADLENPYTRHQLILSCMIIRYYENYLHSAFELPPVRGIL